ncbi:hypothetical protein DOTSEDRAFT_43233 [Dothistroma septosporum NZE10]|uniref:Uncharacterized protein n=1 Tax=Dothistroma septosporum (strain NZE10 / CBS 128990) TaxID=675120 RepID=N1PTQ3_DOTSN|nr:hypothetical protein DOTSEDRAFT_43233 [Dothistroma septosporum NZE10]
MTGTETWRSGQRSVKCRVLSPTSKEEAVSSLQTTYSCRTMHDGIPHAHPRDRGEALYRMIEIAARLDIPQLLLFRMV